MPNGKLSGKVALVTGSSRGIGEAMSDDKPLRVYALRLGQDGANVVVTYAGNKDKAEEVVSAIKANGTKAFTEGVPKAIAIQVNMRNLDDVHNLFQQTLDHFGKLDILVNNAAGKNIFKPTDDMTVEYDSMFDITRGVCFALQQAAHHLADGGRIVNLSTSGTAMAIPAGGAYAGCKAAIEQFSACLAKKLVRGITVNTVAPGVTATDGLVLEQAQVDQKITQIPLGRLGQPADIADAMPQGGLPVKARLTCVGRCRMDYRTAYLSEWRHCLAPMQ